MVHPTQPTIRSGNPSHSIFLTSKHVRAAAAAITLALGSPAFAASATANFDVSIQVLATCAISASNLTFSSITTGTTSNNDATSSLTVNCSTGTPYSISLDNGTNYSGGRRMAGANSYINYYLYSDSGRSAQWNSTLTKVGTGNGSDQNHDVFARIPSGMAVPYVGTYSDTVIATITY